MANNEEISQEVKVEETRPVSAENKSVASPATETNEVKVEQKAEKAKEENKKADKSKDKKKKAKDKKPSKMAKRLKETSSELKKVTWPKFTTVLKQTGVVLLVTALFLLVVFGIDRLCSWLVGFIV
ncbi:MAG: preprotein translocase subunit SecE [Clostridia bacterium]|nr:preprotein translocase subunit SecE [Clostridia bacterium]